MLGHRNCLGSGEHVEGSQTLCWENAAGSLALDESTLLISGLVQDYGAECSSGEKKERERVQLSN